MILRVSFVALTLLFAGGLAAAMPTPKAEEDADSSPFTSYLDCSSFTWMQDCDRINKWVARNPDKPLRLKKNGLEFYFPPGTPSTTVDWVVNQTPQALQRYLEYEERAHAHGKAGAAMYRAALEARGGMMKGMEGIKGITEQKTLFEKARIREQSVSVYMFVDSRCAACASMYDQIGELKRKYPKLFVSILQFDNNQKAAASIQKVTNAPVHVLDAKAKQVYGARVKKVPTIWLEDKRSKRTEVIEGQVTVSQIVRELERISK